MKRSLVVVLTIAMLLFAFVGTAVASEQDDAAARLQGFGIVEGYPDGSMGLDRDITRAEFAKIAVLAKGMGEAAELLKGSASQFSDVQANVWYTGWINVAAANGIVQGDPVGTFRPNDNISNAEAVAMILRVLGYNDNLPGAWPMNYLVKGADLGITTGVVSSANVNAVRGDVFTMLNRALDENVVRWDSDNAEFVNRLDGSNEYTLLQAMMGAKEEAEGRVIENYRNNNKLDKNEIVVLTEEGRETFEFMVDTDVDYLLGLEVTIKHDDGDAYYVEVDTKDEDILYDTVETDDGTEVALLVEDDEFAWAENARVYVNFVSADKGDLTQNMYGKFVLNKDDEIVFAVVFDFNEIPVGFVLDVDGDEIEYVVEGDEEVIFLDDYDDVYVYNSNFELLDVDAIEEGVVIYAWVDADEEEVNFVVVDETISGKLQRTRSGDIRVDGKDYKTLFGGLTSTFSTDENDNFDDYDAEEASDLIGETVTVLLDINGRFVHFYGDAEVTSGIQYGIALDAYTIGRNAYVEVFTVDGKEVEFAFDDNDDADNIVDHFNAGPAITGFSIGDYVPVAYKLNSDGKIAEDLFWIIPNEVASGDVDGVDVTGFTGTFEFNDDYDYIDDGSNRAYIGSSTVIMKYGYYDTDSSSNKYDDEEGLVSWDKIKGSSNQPAKAFVVGEPGKTSKFVVFYEGFDALADDDLYGIVSDQPYYDGDDWITTIDVAGLGEMEYIISSSQRGTFDEGYLVKFNVSASNKVTSPTSSTVTEYVYDRDGDSLKLATVGAGESSAVWVKVAKDAVIYKTDSDGDLDGTERLTRIRKGDTVEYITDDHGVIKAILIRKDL